MGDGEVGEDPGKRWRGKLGVYMIIFLCIHVGNFKNVNKNSDKNKKAAANSSLKLAPSPADPRFIL